MRAWGRYIMGMAVWLRRAPIDGSNKGRWGGKRENERERVREQRKRQQEKGLGWWDLIRARFRKNYSLVLGPLWMVNRGIQLVGSKHDWREMLWKLWYLHDALKITKTQSYRKTLENFLKLQTTPYYTQTNLELRETSHKWLTWQTRVT